MIRYITLLLFSLTIVQTQVGINPLGVNELEIRESFKTLFQSDKIIHATPHVANLIRNGTNGLTNSEIKRLELIDLYPVGDNIIALSPTDLDQIYDTDHFRFYYTLDESSDDAVENEEYVINMGEIFEDVWTFYMDTIGFDPPPIDTVVNQNLYEIYIENLPIYYQSITYATNENVEQPACASYIKIRNSFSASQFNDLTESENIKISAVHEFFHAIQFGYNCFERFWLMEATAVWSEDKLYDEINDHYRYMPSWFANPGKAIDDESIHMYGSFIYFQYIDEHLGGSETIRRVWENSNELADPINDNSFAAIDSALVWQNSNFENALDQMVIANRILSSSTGSGIYSYEEADGYLTVISEPAVYSYLIFSMGEALIETSNHLPLYASDYWTLDINDPVNIDLNNISGSSDDLSLYVVAKLFGQNEWTIQSGDSINLDSQIGFDWISIIVVSVGNEFNNWDYELIITDGQSELWINKPFIINEIPHTYNLFPPYPNPFNPITNLSYNLPEDALVNITIYDMMGRIVSNLVSSQQNAGYKSIQWDATNNQGQPVSAGVYLYRIEAGEFKQTKKMVLLK